MIATTSADRGELPPGGLGLARGHRPPEAPPGREVEVEEQQEHHPAGQVHDVDVDARTARSRRSRQQHVIAGEQQDGDAAQDDREEPAEHPVPQPQPVGRRQLGHARPQDDVGEEHAADPDGGGQRVQGDAEGHARAPGGGQLAITTGSSAAARMWLVAPPKIICRRRLWV